MIEKLADLWGKVHRKSFAVVLKAKHRDLYEWVLNSTDDSFSSFNERVYWLLNPINLICENNKRKKFSIHTKEYGFCGSPKSCQCHLESVKKRGKEANYIGTEEFLKKREKTWQTKYGGNPQKLPEYRNEARNRYTGRKLSKETIYKLQESGYNSVVERLSEDLIPLFSLEEYKGCFRKNSYEWKCKHCGNLVQGHVDYGTKPRCTVCNPKQISSGEFELRNFITNLGFEIEINNRNLISPLEIDIFVPEKRIAFEFNGVYWHSEKINSDKKYHVKKYNLCKENGVHLIQIFEDEWSTKKDIVLSRIKSVLGVSDKVYARKCVVREIDSKTATEFLDAHHIQGSTPSLVKLGLYHESTIVALMTFGKSRFKNNSEYELLRYCSLGTVVGGASKLFSYFIKKYDPNSVVSYADRCWSNGDLYKKLGFINVTEDPENIGYFYVKNNIRYNRTFMMKKRLVKIGYSPDLTESEIATQLKFMKIYNCGNYKFVWSKFPETSLTTQKPHDIVMDI